MILENDQVLKSAGKLKQARLVVCFNKNLSIYEVYLFSEMKVCERDGNFLGGGVIVFTYT